jgi:TolB-like protein/DNA-binding winged helix-turn-helix (wHTH) protein
VPQSTPISRRVHFAEFEADLRAGELFRSGQKVKLQERPFQVLAALLEHPGEVVTRDELRQRIWPADTFVDYGHGLAVAINKLREALRDSSEQPRFVETVGRRGYRFVAEVERTEVHPARVEVEEPFAGGPLLGSVAPLPEESVVALPRKTLRMAAIVIAALFIVAAAISWRIAARRGKATTGVPNISSLAVLPLENLSKDPEQEYFVEGMTDEITTDVAKLSGLRVISRTSAMQYKGSHKSLPEIAHELNVDGVVEGTVERLGDRVRIRTQLIYAPTDRHIWAEAYERDVKDMLNLETTVANDIASQIQLTLTSQQARAANPRTVNPEAHELYLKGRYYWNKRDPQDLSLGVQYFQQAIARDPGYALAYAGLADGYALLGERCHKPRQQLRKLWSLTATLPKPMCRSDSSVHFSTGTGRSPKAISRKRSRSIRITPPPITGTARFI